MASMSTSTRHGRALRRTMIAAGSLLATAVPALAQNSEGPHQVRVGAFLQGGTTTLDGTLAGASETGHAANNGGGITAGLEWLRGGWAYGVEGDLGLTNGAASVVGASYATDYFASIRGRLGIYARPDWLLYGTAGFGARGVSVREPAAFGFGQAAKTLTGAVYGGGTEFHRGNTIFFAEYLHSQYGGGDVTVNSTVATIPMTQIYGIKGSSDAFRLGVKFKVGFDGYYDEVRDGLRK